MGEWKFAADRNLGKLAKWLRILGYDTLYDRGDSDRLFLQRAADEKRVALTRRRDLVRVPKPGLLIVVESDRVGVQMKEVFTALKGDPDPARRMTRCLICNETLAEIAKESVAGSVPAYVFETCARFRRCPRCCRIFWPGTHTRQMDRYLRERLAL